MVRIYVVKYVILIFITHKIVTYLNAARAFLMSAPQKIKIKLINIFQLRHSLYNIIYRDNNNNGIIGTK